MTITKYAMCYPQHDTTTLRNFIEARTGVLPTRGRKKIAYVKQLREMDRTSTFDFMGLPPELRVVVYRLLFAFRHECHLASCRKNHVSILRASKAIHEEAKRVLYAERIFRMYFVGRLAPKPTNRAQTSLAVGGDILKRTEYFVSDVPLSSYSAILPAHLSSIRHLELSIDVARPRISGPKRVNFVSNGWTEQILIRINRALYRLACELMDSRRLRTLVVQVSIRAKPLHISRLEKALFPLAMLLSLRQRGIVVRIDGLRPRVMSYLSQFRALVVRQNTFNELHETIVEASQISGHLWFHASRAVVLRKLEVAIDHGMDILETGRVVDNVLERKAALARICLRQMIDSRALQLLIRRRDSQSAIVIEDC
ncbi:uncharacterized protein LTR77_006476 [Saxophila tyrrhenica]|uniref:Maturase n=1 Tax=Saxophila tyrrhenica TaxID=1690608 RepID=A0AAV9P8K3_9PEZI|nr:hypothetical protein LTR77_006476 [Saxophila tyrrhenica]